MEVGELNRLLDKIDKLSDICTGTAVEVTNLKNEVGLLRVFRHDYGNLVQGFKGVEDDLQELGKIVRENRAEIIVMKKDIEYMGSRMLSWKAVGIWIVGTALTVFGLLFNVMKG